MSATTPPPPGDEDGRGSSGTNPPDHDLPPIDDPSLVVPDDLSELTAEVEAYQRERKVAARRATLRRFVPLSPVTRRGLSGPIVVTALLVVGLVGALLTVFGPRVRDQIAPPVRPLASPTVPVGQRGGLLPSGTLRAGSGRLETHMIRSAVVLLLPAPCNCADVVRQVVGQSREVHRLNAYLVSPAAGAAEAADLATKVSGPTRGVVDEAGLLARTYHADPKAPTLLLVGDDGVLLAGPRAVHDGDRLETLFEAYQPLPA